MKIRQVWRLLDERKIFVCEPTKCTPTGVLPHCPVSSIKCMEEKAGWCVENVMKLKRQEVQNITSIFVHLIHRNTAENVLRRARTGQCIPYNMVVTGVLAVCRHLWQQKSLPWGQQRERDRIKYSKKDGVIGRVKISNNPRMIYLVLWTSVG